MRPPPSTARATWGRFRTVTLPFLRSTMTFLLVVLTIGGFSTFVRIYVMSSSATGVIGGPLNSTDVVLTYTWKQAFGGDRFRLRRRRCRSSWQASWRSSASSSCASHAAAGPAMTVVGRREARLRRAFVMPQSSGSRW